MTFILSLLQNKYFKILIAIILTLIILAILFNTIYQNGVDAGVNKQKIIQQELENKHIALIEKQQKKIDEYALKINENETKIKVIYKDKIKEVEKIITKTEYKNCQLSDEDYQNYIKVLEEIK